MNMWPGASVMTRSRGIGHMLTTSGPAGTVLTSVRHIGPRVYKLGPITIERRRPHCGGPHSGI